jgi:hypothetical protein
MQLFKEPIFRRIKVKQFSWPSVDFNLKKMDIVVIDSYLQRDIILIADFGCVLKIFYVNLPIIYWQLT